ncbi:methyl-accepting chemotaxis protein [Cellulomonas sp. C5510]|uniref:methyl-accepting chemotaxis protein n=1 Tax=Cellulomonas sp. C5510 TaxID=2871170 RepID=UPI001C95A303|nr:methyl-accepting chemotaxis protein [Cellulomonas sp. C5510]QZN84691.1 methyl-accepting chemotaxis protein [Cellulomonas sp. C5510]
MSVPALHPRPDGTTSPGRPHRRRFGDLGVRTRIVASVLVGVVAAGAVGASALAALARTDAATASVYDDDLLGFERVAAMRRSTLEMRLDVTSHALAADEASRQAFVRDIAALDAAIAEDLGAVVEDAGGAGDEPLAEGAAAFADALASYQQLRDGTLLPAAERGDIAAWQRARDMQAAPLITTMMDALATMVDGEKASAQESVAEAHAAYVSNRTLVVALLAAGLVLALTLGLVTARGILRAVERVRVACDALADGDLTVEAGLDTQDEPGRAAQSLDRAIGTLREVVGDIDTTSVTLAAAAEQLSGSAQQIAAQAEQTEAQAGVVSAAAEEVSRTTQTVAAGTQQMDASIQEISRSTSEAARISDQAARSAAETTAVIERLGESSRQIGDVVKSIAAIAGQTNLLALNATIEAARAGQEGKGFAVVAGEVKDLAQETGDATEDIARRVEAIQADAARAVEAVAEISRVVGAVHELQTTVAAAVEEQTATTAEIGRNVTEAAGGSGQIAENIAGVAQAAAVTRDGSAESERAAGELAALSGRLRGVVGQFRYRVPAGPGGVSPELPQQREPARRDAPDTAFVTLPTA